jgi:MSHA biogenesis protein MshJ
MSPAFSKVVVALAPVRNKIDGLSRRERLLIMITTLVFIVAVWHLLLMAPLATQADAGRAELDSLQERITNANQTLEEQILQLADVGSADRTRVVAIQRRIDEINEDLGNYASELIDPGEMARVLEEVLKEQTSLRLVRMANLPPESITAGEQESATRFYRHVLEIEVEGSYRACMDYMSEIEALPWRLYWQLLDLEVVEYPLNRIRIEVSTLSLDEEWIGA